MYFFLLPYSLSLFYFMISYEGEFRNRKKYAELAYLLPISRNSGLQKRMAYEDGTSQKLSLYRPAPWTKFCPRFAPKMGTYVSREFSLTTEFTRTYVRTMYCEIFVRVIFRVIQLIPKTPMMGFVIGSHDGASLCRHVVHHIRSY